MAHVLLPVRDMSSQSVCLPLRVPVRVPCLSLMIGKQALAH